MARPPSKSLTPAQSRVLNAVLRRESLQLPNFVSDLVSELDLKAESSLGATLRRMARLGVILLQGGGIQGRQRLVLPTHKGRLLSALFSEHGDSLSPAPHALRLPPHIHPPSSPPPLHFLPLLGTIPAGPLEEVITQGDAAFETVSVNDLLKHRPGDFLLRIKGQSMVGDGIFNGDLVLLRPGLEVQQGEIAAVVWSGSGAECEATLKRVFRQPAAEKTGVQNKAAKKTAPKAQPPAQNTVLLRASNPSYADMILPADSVRIAGVFRGLIRLGSPPNPSRSTSLPEASL